MKRHKRTPCALNSDGNWRIHMTAKVLLLLAAMAGTGPHALAADNRLATARADQGFSGDRYARGLDSTARQVLIDHAFRDA